MALFALGLLLAASAAFAPTVAMAETVEQHGAFTVTVADEQAATYSYNDGVLSITGGVLTVANTNPGTPTTDRIYIKGNVDVTFAGVNIERSESGSPVEVDDNTGTDVTIRLRGENSLVASASKTAALRKSRGQTGGGETGKLKITSASGDGCYDGSLYVKATGSSSAAIGAVDYHGDVTDITIAGGTVEASASHGAAIGSTGGGSTWRMLIAGGIVKALGGDGLGADTPNGVREFQVTGGYVVTTEYHGSTPTGGLVSTDGGTSFAARGECEVPPSQSPLETTDLTIEAGATLTVPEGSSIKTSGTVINNGSVTGGGTLESEGVFYNNGTLDDGIVSGDITERLVTIEGGTANGHRESQTIDGGTRVTVKADERTGMVFSGWEITMGQGVELVDKTAPETTFTMPEVSCVSIRATYEYLFGTIVTETDEEIPVTDANSWGLSTALSEAEWKNYPKSTFRLTAPDGTASDVSSNLNIPYDLPEGATIDLNGRTMSVGHGFDMTLPEGASELTVCNGTLEASYDLMVSGLQLTLEDVVLSAGQPGDELRLSVSSSDLVLGEGTSFSGDVAKVSISGYGSGSVTMPCSLAEDSKVVISEGVNLNTIHSWADNGDGTQTCPSCGLRRGAAELVLNPSTELVYDGETLTVDDMGMTALRDGADCSGDVVFTNARVNDEGATEYVELGLPRYAGTYQITATLYGTSSDDRAYDTVSQTVQVKIAPRPVTVRYTGSVTAASKTYDGTTAAVLSGIEGENGLVLDGILPGDSWVRLTSYAVHGEFADRNVGESKVVRVLLGDSGLNNDNYTLSSNEVTVASGPVTASIAPLTATLAWQNTTGRYFGDGKVVTASVSNAVEGDDVLAQVSGGDVVEVGTHTATAALAGADAGNYVLAGGAGTVTYDISSSVVTPEGTEAEVANEAGEPSGSFVYGDTISVRIKPSFSPAASGQNALARALVEPQSEQMALYYGDKQISEPASADAEGWYTMTYDTGDGIVPAGTASETLVARLIGSDNVSGFETTVTVSIAKAPQAAPEGVVSVDEITVGEGGALTALPAGGEWRPAGGGAWQKVPEDGTIEGLPEGDYEVRLPGSSTHEPSATITVAVKGFSSTHGGATYPAGTTDPGDGTAVLPEAGGVVTFPNGATATLPGGAVFDPEAESATTPGGVVVTPAGGGLSITLPGGAVVSAGSVVVAQDGSVTLPEGGEIAYRDGTTGQVAAGETVAPDVEAPEIESDERPAEKPVAEETSEPGDEALAKTGDVTSLVPAAVAAAAGITAFAGVVTLRRREK